MLGKTKNWPGKENHSWLHGLTVTCLSTVIIIKVLNNNITKITILLGEWGDGEKANLPHLEFTGYYPKIVFERSLVELLDSLKYMYNFD